MSTTITKICDACHENIDDTPVVVTLTVSDGSSTRQADYHNTEECLPPGLADLIDRIEPTHAG